MYSQKSEAAKKELKGAVDYVLTFEEIMALFEAFDIDLAKCSNEDIDDASILEEVLELLVVLQKL